MVSSKTDYQDEAELSRQAKALAKRKWEDPEEMKERSRWTEKRKRKEDEEEDDIPVDPDSLAHFRNYQPPGRLVIVEFTTLVILTMLLLANPEGATAIATAGATGGIGLLRSCSGTCTSWLGASGGGSRAGGGSTVAARDLESRQNGGSASSSSSSDPTSFHLTAGLAAIVTFYTVLFAWLFHLARWWYYRIPPLHSPEREEQDTKGLSWRKKLKKRETWDGTKRFGYRVSRAFTLANIPLLVYITFSSIMMAKDTGVGTGFYLLLWLCINSVLVALWEFLNPEGKIGSKLLMWRAVRWRPGGKVREKAQIEADRLDRAEKGREINLRHRTLRGGQKGFRRRSGDPPSPRLPPKAASKDRRGS